jgi:hypothetical protein
VAFKTRRFIIPALLILAAAITGGGAIRIRRMLESRMGPNQITTRPAVGAKIAALPIGTSRVEAKSRLGPPDGQRSDGTYTEWSYIESFQTEGWHHEGMRFQHYRRGSQIEHRLLFRGDQLFFAWGSDVEVGTWNREVALARRRLSGPVRMPPVPLGTGVDLHTALSSIVDGRTTLAEIEALLGSPAQKRQEGALLNLVYRVSTATSAFAFVVNLRDGIVVENPYSPPGTEADEAVRELFYRAYEWPEVPATSREP